MPLWRRVHAYSLDICRIEECRPELFHRVSLPLGVIGPIYWNYA
jgi:hypothetical protein